MIGRPGQQVNVEVARRGPVPVNRMPATRYARSGDHNIAYSVSGAGPIDLVLVSGLVSQIEHVWAEPSLARFLAKLGEFARIVLFDPRGAGLSDALGAGGVPSLDDRVTDIAAVMDAAGLDRAAIIGFSNGGPPAIAMAAEHPDQVSALILVSTTARTPLAPAYPNARSLDEFIVMLGVWAQQWGTGAGIEDLAPSVAEDARMREWWATCQRLTAGPGTIVDSLRLLRDFDMTDTLAAIRAPTLVMHAEADKLISVAAACEIADRIPGAHLALSAGADHLFWLGDQNERLDTIRDFLAQLLEGRDVPALRKRRSRPPSGWESLTPAELDVAWLVAEGFTNPDIARRFSVSPRTVQTHLKHIFWKLNVARRSEVAAEAARRLIAA